MYTCIYINVCIYIYIYISYYFKLCFSRYMCLSRHQFKKKKGGVKYISWSVHSGV